MRGVVSPESRSHSSADPAGVPKLRLKGFPFVISGPSGVGKTSVYKPLLADPHIAFSVSVTTRPKRPGEQQGREYLFCSEDEFQLLLASGGFVEHAEVHGSHYGTPRGPLERWIADGKVVILDVDVQGGVALRAAYPNGVFVFILPPSMEELRRRLETRGSDPPEVIARRLANAPAEIAQFRHYGYAVVNDHLSRAQAEVAAILTAERCSVGRLGG